MTHVRFNRTPFQNVLDQFITEAFDHVVPAVKGHFNKPATNIAEDETSFKIEIVAPGFTKNDLKLGIEKNILKNFCTKRDRNRKPREQIQTTRV